jgi:membrane associated rhomboid family serine protease
MVSIGGQRLEMLPIGPAIRSLLLINIAVFVVNMLAVGKLVDWFGLTWDGLFDGYGLGLLRFVTYQFTHSPDIRHILFNMISLYVFGGIVEEYVGKTRTIRLYLWSGFAGGVVELIVAGMLGIRLPMVGASGACFGLMVYAACTAPNRQIILILFQVPLWIVAGLFTLIALYDLHLQFVLGRVTGVADGAHVGGAAFGALAWKLHRTTTFLDRWRDGVRDWRRGRAAARDAHKEATLDQVLAKVKQEGLSSLTASERRVLDRASKDLRAR